MIVKRVLFTEPSGWVSFTNNGNKTASLVFHSPYCVPNRETIEVPIGDAVGMWLREGETLELSA